jgi:hypothetical protein
MKFIARTFICLVLLAVFAAGARQAAGQAPPGEYEVKAAFLYNVLAFVEWPLPENKSADTLRICILGASAAGKAFDDLDGQVIMGRKIEIVHLTSLADVGRCSVLFIGSSEERNIHRIMRALQGTSILSIGDTAGFARQGVIINFYLEQKKVRFEVNAAAARQAGLVISSKLLKLAGSVYGASPAGE